MALAELQELERDALMNTYARNPVEFVRGEGTRLWDDEGNEYLDFLTGISVAQLGHCHPRVVEAVREQAGRLMHVGNLFYTEPGMRLAKRLAELSLGGKVFLCNSGAEAIECALKLARKRRTGGEFVVMEGGFHGRTMGALSATPAGVQAGAVRAARAGLSSRAAQRRGRPARGRGRRHGRRPPRADPGRVGHPPARPGAARRRARGLRRSTAPC